MSKTMSFKISIFTLISTVICIIGNMILDLDIISYVCQGLGFLSFLFFIIWVSQWIYEKAIFCINLISMFISFALAVYSLALFTLIPYERAFEYYVLFFYLFSLIFLLSTIIFVGRIIFNIPTKSSDKLSPTESTKEMPPIVETDETKNTEITQ